MSRIHSNDQSIEAPRVVKRPVAIARNPNAEKWAKSSQGVSVKLLVFLSIGQLLLAILCRASSIVSTLHALGTFIVGIALVVKWKGPFPLVCWAAYEAGSEVLWRMTNAMVPWEAGKYVLCLIFVLGILRKGFVGLPLSPIIYFALLLPGLLPALSQPIAGELRKVLSFSMSGPLCAATSALLVAGIKIDTARAQRVAMFLVLSVIGVAGVVLFGIRAAAQIDFGGSANFEVSGGFGPNQVSGVLGFGAFFAFVSALNLDMDWRARLLYLVTAMWFIAHAALSFSRTGIYIFAVGVLVALPFLPQKWIIRPTTGVVFAIAIVSGVAVWGYLERFTDGKIGERFARTDSSGRDRIASADLQIWGDNLVFGVGTGMSSAIRAQMTGNYYASHTEYTRLLAEHGLLGLVSGLILIGFLGKALWTGVAGFEKALIIAGTTMALSSLLASGMRTALPCFLLGCAWLEAPAKRDKKRLQNATLTKHFT